MAEGDFLLRWSGKQKPGADSDKTKQYAASRKTLSLTGSFLMVLWGTSMIDPSSQPYNIWWRFTSSEWKSMQIRIPPSNGREMILAINALKRSKVAGLDGLPHTVHLLSDRFMNSGQTFHLTFDQGKATRVRLWTNTNKPKGLGLTAPRILPIYISSRTPRVLISLAILVAFFSWRDVFRVLGSPSLLCLKFRNSDTLVLTSSWGGSVSIFSPCCYGKWPLPLLKSSKPSLAPAFTASLEYFDMRKSRMLHWVDE